MLMAIANWLARNAVNLAVYGAFVATVWGMTRESFSSPAREGGSESQ